MIDRPEPGTRVIAHDSDGTIAGAGVVLATPGVRPSHTPVAMDGDRRTVHLFRNEYIALEVPA
jgi:hypothetical protein